MRALRSRRVVTPAGVRPATLLIDRETIARIESYELALEDIDTIDAGNDVVMPGVVDAHVHVNEPGRTEWEGFEHATRAAAAGGVTTIVDMPLNSIPATTDRAAFQRKQEAARGRLAVDVGFWGGVVPGNAGALERLWVAGVLGFKCFLVPSGVPEFPHVTEEDLEQALPLLARLGAPLLVHAELPEYVAPVPGAQRSYDTYRASRPIEAETAAIDLMIRLAERHRARVHIVHVSSAEGAQRIHDAKRQDVRITGETCPHYLTFESGEIPDGATVFKCAPPIRERSARAALWDALDSGALDFVASDHSPAPPSMKALDSGDFMSAWGGIASLQLLLPAVWTGARANGMSLACIANWLAQWPAALAGLAGRKGSFTPGADADIVVWDPDDSFVVDPRHLFHRHPLTPYTGRQLHGVVRQTWLRGEVVYDGRRHLRTDAGHITVR
ncbi:MAG TPA: allantoinase AllB [Vicinamibacterales bacterium]|jgi:allantoinase|nr:allantoinase AllB [Vicinamibacterales bacterium]